MVDLLAVQEIPLVFGNFQKNRPPAILAFENIITPYFKENKVNIFHQTNTASLNYLSIEGLSIEEIL